MNGSPRGYGGLACAAGFALLTWALAAGALLDLDVAVRDWVDTHRPETLRLAAKALYFLGSANLIASILLRRPVAAGQRRTLLVAPVVIVFPAVTYLGYHWITDCVAGVLSASRCARRCGPCRWVIHYSSTRMTLQEWAAG